MSIEVFKICFRIDSFEFWESWLEIWKLVNVIPITRSWCTMKLEDFKNLIYLRVSIKHWFFLDKFSKNASNSPYINSQAVLLLSKKHFRSSIPESLYLMSKCFDWNSKGTSKPKICNLQIASTIN